METLNTIITTHAMSDSIVITDCWKGSNEIQIFFEHMTVNHSENYVNPETGATTNTIKGTWNDIKHQVVPRNRVISIKQQLSFFSQ
ncbi:hypothetical protein SteCoe_12757 [Stentor coeruleus]|uniref:DDE-1 domain-containing protein n=1 Tax=Stentor coeruleus TaxID=5963 RepID=A0A1R2CA15_9CILI|nr:hypothetical protein SteCoe_12757 [Stentor coeruleus]